MATKVFNGSNNLSCARFYLDPRTADVNFVFKISDDITETVPAHKIILSAGSPVFEAMFYGPMKELGDVKIVNVSLGQFKEFLQFFYLDKFRLTFDNIIGVTKLCHKYEVVNGLTLCESALQQLLTIDNMYSGYEMAILLEFEKVVKLCEEKIRLNPYKMWHSPDFLKCSQNTVAKIVELLSSQGIPEYLLFRCINWAHNKIKKKNMTFSNEKMKNELGSIVTVLESQLQSKFSINNMCSVYYWALEYDLKSTIEFCEQQIKQYSEELLKSDAFLKCFKRNLENIIKLVSSNCNPLIIVEAAMKWTKASEKTNMEEKTENEMKNEIGAMTARILLQNIDVNHLCTLYEAVITFDLDRAIELCEEKIKENPDGILKSANFLKCHPETLEKILTVSSKCSPSTIVEAAMNWVKAESKRKSTEAMQANLKIELGSLVGKIPFAKLAADEFAEFLDSYKDLVSSTDFKAIVRNFVRKKEDINEKSSKTLKRKMQNPRTDQPSKKQPS